MSIIPDALFTDVIFYAVAALMIIASIVTVVAKNLLQSAVFLIVSFIGTAILYLMLHAEFIAMAQIMVYAGGVVIFVVFTVLLTSHLGETTFNIKLPRNFIAGAIALGLLFTMVRFLFRSEAIQNATAPLAAGDYASLPSLALRLLSADPSGFLIPFELVSFVLLTTLVLSITVARKSKEEK
jgi:NADH-quinone oxidoreductase subunit J